MWERPVGEGILGYRISVLRTVPFWSKPRQARFTSGPQNLDLQESWAAYAKYAMGFDELAPVSLKGKNSFGGLGAMVIDSLDTLWMFGLREEFQLYDPSFLARFTLNFAQVSYLGCNTVLKERK